MSPDVPTGFGPAQFHAAYGLPTTSGKAQTIAVVDSYRNPHVLADLNDYDAAFGLPSFPKCTKKLKASCLSVLNEHGKASPLPARNAGWGLEIDLDVEVAHAVCQNCRILLMEAASNNLSDLEVAVDSAVAKKANVVSNSYGDYGDDCSEPGYDHPRVAIVAGAGDGGFANGVACPAVLNTVVSVGGTTLTLASDGSYGSESVYNSTGSGCASVNAAPSWQTSNADWAATGCGSGRGMNDVAADAGGGAAVYDSYAYAGWVTEFGTSVATPLIAGTYALAANASSWAYPAQSVYAASSGLHDVVTGSNGSCTIVLQCQAGAGYDLPSGNGTPDGLGAF